MDSSLVSLLNTLVGKLKQCFDSSLPLPSKLAHSGEMTVRGRTAEVHSSVPLDEITSAPEVTVYLHLHSASAAPADADETEMGGAPSAEIVRYFHFSQREPLSTIYITLTEMDGSVRQTIHMASLPKERAVGIVENFMGQGKPRFGGRRPSSRRRFEQPPAATTSF